MKLISEGNQSLKQAEAHAECPHCGARMLYNRSDVSTRKQVHGKLFHAIECPWCGQTMIINLDPRLKR